MRVIITGAASGIGRAVAKRLAAGSNVKLLLVDRNEEALVQLSEQVSGEGVETEPYVADLTDPDTCVSVVKQMQERFNGLDALVSNAGGVRGAPLLDLDLEAFDYSFALNTRPTWLMSKAAHAMLRESRGAIVATASTAGEYPTPPLGTYAASKAALIMLVRQMAAEWGEDGIRCNVVSPGPTLTGITETVYSDPNNRRLRASHIPLGRIGQPEDIAEAILFLIDKRSAYISGVNITVDGGLVAGLMRATGAGSGNLRND